VIMDNPTRVLRENTEILHKKEENLAALWEGQLREAAQLYRAGDDPAVLFREVCEKPLCSREFAAFCRMAAETAATSDAASLLPESERTDAPPPGDTVAFLPNPYTEQAFSVLAADTPSLHQVPAPSFVAACEDVYNGRCGFCILPLHHSRDGILSAFARMIKKYDLKICAVCDLPLSEEDATMRYALLRRTLDPHIPDAGFLETTVTVPASVGYGDFLCACRQIGAEAVEITSVPLQYAKDMRSATVCFSVTRRTLIPLLLFLGSVLGNYTVHGIFARKG